MKLKTPLHCLLPPCPVSNLACPVLYPLPYSLPCLPRLIHPALFFTFALSLSPSAPSFTPSASCRLLLFPLPFLPGPLPCLPCPLPFLPLPLPPALIFTLSARPLSLSALSFTTSAPMPYPFCPASSPFCPLPTNCSSFTCPVFATALPFSAPPFIKVVVNSVIKTGGKVQQQCCFNY